MLATVSQPQTHLCLSTLFADPMQIGADDLRSAIDAAGAAGFDGVSLWTFHHLMASGDGMDDAELADRLAANGLVAPIVEAMPGWANAADDAAVRGDAGFALGVAAAVGATCAVAVCMEPEFADRDRTVANLALVGDIAADSGIDIAVEFLPWTAIDSYRTCLRLLEDCDRDNVGVLLDSWHWQRQPGGPVPDALAGTDPNRIKLVQLCDTTPTPSTDDVYAEAMTERLVPGSGTVDLGGLLDGLEAIGATPLLSPEVFSSVGQARGAATWAGDIKAACDKVLAGRFT